MDFIFKDEAFKFETVRAAGFAGDAGADIGEVLVTTAQIPDGDEDAWTAAWRSTAERIAERGATLPRRWESELLRLAYLMVVGMAGDAEMLSRA